MWQREPSGFLSLEEEIVTCCQWNEPGVEQMAYPSSWSLLSLENMYV